MKARISVVSILLVIVTFAITSVGSWSAAQPSATSADVLEARLAADQAASQAQRAETPAPGDDFKSSPMMFIENLGQWDEHARFRVWGGPAGTMWLAEDAIWITVLEPRREETSSPGDKGSQADLRSRLLWQPTYLPLILSAGTPIRLVGLNPAEGPVDTLVALSISGQWTPGVQVFVTLAPRGVPIPPPDGQAVSTGASATTSNDGSPVVTQFRVPNDPRLLGPQPIQVVVHTGNWSEWVVEPFTIVD